MTDRPDVTVAIPTYGRDEVLVDTVEQMLGLQPPARDLWILDQTPEHAPSAQQRLEEWNCSGHIEWVRLATPSTPAAMNRALSRAPGAVMLFVDDDIVPGERLVQAHAEAHAEKPDVWAVSGQVLQPGETSRDAAAPPAASEGWLADLDFPFYSSRPAVIENVMAGNLSVKREAVTAIGGFDEQFVGAAYRFESDFAKRIVHAGGKIHYEPAASIKHLRASRGGTRMHGSHLTSASPMHGVGDYYFALRHGEGAGRDRYIRRRLMREISTRFHLTHPWYVPIKLVGEIRALALARRMVREGPRLMSA